jgi:hypothetical protein
MPVFPLKRNLHVAIGCALAGALLVAAAPARAQQDESAPEVKILDSVMGALGLTRGTGPGIDYRERSPLVLPRNDTLPPPESAKVADPNWPVDPEVKQARALAKAGREGDGRTSSQRMDDAARPLSQAELNRGRTNRKQNNPTRGDEGLLPSSWAELGYKGGVFGNMFGRRPDDHPAAFTGEEARTSLIDPPTGYQTPSPAQPYGLGKSSYKDKAYDPYADRKYEK